MEEMLLKLVNMSITAGIMILAVMLLRPFLKKAPRSVNVALWALVAIRLAVPVSMESDLSLIPEAEPVSRTVLYYQNTNAPAGAGSQYDAAAVEGYSATEAVAGENADHADKAAFTGADLLDIAPYIWLGGAALMLAYSIVSYARIRMSVATAVRSDEGIFECESVASPFVLGLFRARIYLPFNMEEAARRHVVMHERAHIARRDNWIKPFGYLLLSIYWFNPLVWAAYALLCRDIELACDERVIKALDGDARREYSSAQLALSTRGRAIAACPLAFGETGVRERIKRVLNYKKPAFWAIVAALAVCAAVAVCFLTDPRGDGNDGTLLDYRSAAVSAGNRDKVNSIYCPDEQTDGEAHIYIGEAWGEELKSYLDSAEWRECSKPRTPLPSAGSVEFIIEDDYRVTVYRARRRAVVRMGEETRWYRTGRSDYASAVSLTGSAGSAGEAYRFGECIYMNPASSYYPVGSTGFIYVLYDDCLMTKYENTRKLVGTLSFDGTTDSPFTDAQWAALFYPEETAPDISGYAESARTMRILGDYSRLFTMDGELWLMEQQGGYAWSVISLEPAPMPAPATVQLAHNTRFVTLSDEAANEVLAMYDNLSGEASPGELEMTQGLVAVYMTVSNGGYHKTECWRVNGEYCLPEGQTETLFMGDAGAAYKRLLELFNEAVAAENTSD